MKITKQRLREIIKEELSVITEHRDQLVAPGLGNDVRFITIEGGLAGHQTEPRHEGGTPEERLLNKLLIRSKIEKAGGDPQRAAEMFDLGDDEEVIAYLANLMGNPMYAPTGMEEAADSKLAKARSEKTLPDSKKGAPEAYNKAQRQYGKKIAKDHK